MRSSKLLATLAAGFMLLASQSALAEGDAAKGKKLFGRCKACHTVVPGKHKVGPSLYGVVGRTSGTAEGFKKYTPQIKEAAIVWTEEALDEFLPNPQKLIPKTKMRFKVKKEQDRADLIAYLNEVGQSE